METMHANKISEWGANENQIVRSSCHKKLAAEIAKLLKVTT